MSVINSVLTRQSSKYTDDIITHPEPSLNEWKVSELWQQLECGLFNKMRSFPLAQMWLSSLRTITTLPVWLCSTFRSQLFPVSDILLQRSNVLSTSHDFYIKRPLFSLRLIWLMKCGDFYMLWVIYLLFLKWWRPGSVSACWMWRKFVYINGMTSSQDEEPKQSSKCSTPADPERPIRGQTGRHPGGGVWKRRQFAHNMRRRLIDWRFLLELTNQGGCHLGWVPNVLYFNKETSLIVHLNSFLSHAHMHTTLL